MRISPSFFALEKGKYKVHLALTEAAFSRLKKLLLRQYLIDEKFIELVITLYETLDEFGKTLALDGKIILFYASFKFRRIYKK